MAARGTEEGLTRGAPPECVVFIGLPGSGKTTFYRERFAATHLHISKDALPPGSRDRRQQGLIRDALAQGRSFVVDNTHLARADRAAPIRLARAAGFIVTGYFFEASTREAIARNSRRSGKARVPNVAIFAAAKRLEPPSRDEGFHRVFGVRARNGTFEVTDWEPERGTAGSSGGRHPSGVGVYDSIIVGGGPAGLSAALVLGRSRRRVVVCDEGKPRNARSRALNAFLSRDGIDPAEFLRLARDQLNPYGVEMRRTRVVQACRRGDRFEITLNDKTMLIGRTLLVATGVADELPDIVGLGSLYGRSVFHCPYCDGWEIRDQPLAVYGRGVAGVGLALSLKTWSADVVLCTGGMPAGKAHAERLKQHGIRIDSRRIVRLEGEDGMLRRIHFDAGEPLERRALFFTTGQSQRSDLPVQLGCVFNRKGTVRTNRLEGTGVPGLYVAGDASEDVQLAIVAAAEGAKAGFAMNELLQARDGLAVEGRASRVESRGVRIKGFRVQGSRVGT